MMSNFNFHNIPLDDEPFEFVEADTETQRREDAWMDKVTEKREVVLAKWAPCFPVHIDRLRAIARNTWTDDTWHTLPVTRFSSPEVYANFRQMMKEYVAVPDSIPHPIWGDLS